MRFFLLVLLTIIFPFGKQKDSSWIRINLLGYQPNGIKVAVWCSKDQTAIKDFQLVDSSTGKIAFQKSAGNAFGAYGPFTQTYRLNFSAFKKPGTYYLKAGDAVSPFFKIGNEVYKGAADFCLR